MKINEHTCNNIRQKRYTGQENYTGFKDISEFPIITPLLSLFEKKM